MKAANWATPGAKQELPWDADRDVWLQARRTGIGGTAAVTLQGANPYQSPYDVWLDLKGLSEPVEQSGAMRRGQITEGPLADEFGAQTGIAVRKCGLLRSREHRFQLANVDRLTADGGILECKSHSAFANAARQWREDGVSKYALIQSQHYLAVTGRSHAWFAVDLADDWHIFGPIPRDEELIARMREQQERFWVDHVLADVPPPMDPATVTDDELKQRFPSVEDKSVAGGTADLMLLDQRAELAAAIRYATAAKKAVDTQLKARIGDARFLTVEGRPVLERVRVIKNAYTVDEAVSFQLKPVKEKP